MMEVEKDSHTVTNIIKKCSREGILSGVRTFEMIHHGKKQRLVQ